jgi:hypothetical protein
MWERDEYALHVAYCNHSLLGRKRKVQILKAQELLSEMITDGV